MSTHKKTMPQLAAEALREYSHRKATYTAAILAGHMTRPEAQHRLDCQKEIMRMLRTMAKPPAPLTGLDGVPLTPVGPATTAGPFGGHEPR